jgi:pimeloyl-ACP methyl ester carboxylesterase
MIPSFCISTDNARIAYTVTGTGPALMLLHGAGKTRLDWHKLGYVDRLQQDFTVITVDLRGSGESDQFLEPADYAIEKICNDLYAVADACAVKEFAVWGYSFGGSIARYLAAWSNRVTAVAAIGVSLGPAVDETFDRYIDEFEQKYGHLIQPYRTGDLNEKQRDLVLKRQIPELLACFKGMREWPTIALNELRCPVMLLIGTKNKNAMNWLDAHRQQLVEARIRVETVAGLTHLREFSQVDRVFPVISQFLQNQIVDDKKEGSS